MALELSYLQPLCFCDYHSRFTRFSYNVSYPTFIGINVLSDMSGNLGVVH